MSLPGGNALVRRRIEIRGDRARGVVSALAEALGHQVVERGDEGAPHLRVVEVDHPGDLTQVDDATPNIAVAFRRLRSNEVRAFKEAGASCVVDLESSVLDVAFAFSDLLFPTLCQQRRYARRHGGVLVRFTSMDGDEATGSLLGVARSGALVASHTVLAEGTTVEIEMDLGDTPVPVRGRVAYVAEHDDPPGFGIEFALDDDNVAPKLSHLMGTDRPSSIGVLDVLTPSSISA